MSYLLFHITIVFFSFVCLIFFSILGSLGLELQRLKSWRKVFEGGVFVEPHMPELREFKNYFLSALQVKIWFLFSDP